MYHTPNIDIVELQSEALEIPLVLVESEGEKEKELDDLKAAILFAVEKHSIEGVVTGAVGSVYQATRVQKICAELGLWCFNPVWQKDQMELLQQTIDLGFLTMISSVAAYPFDETWLGRLIDSECVSQLGMLQQKFKGASDQSHGRLIVLASAGTDQPPELTSELLLEVFVKSVNIRHGTMIP